MSSKQQKIPQMGFDQRWIQHQRKTNKLTQTWACANCIHRPIFTNTDDLWSHCVESHQEKVPSAESERRRYRTRFEAESLSKRTAEPPRTKDEYHPRRPVQAIQVQDANEPPPSKRPLSSMVVAANTRSLSGLKELHINTPGGSEQDVTMRDLSEDGDTPDQPHRKRPAIGEGISAGSASPCDGSVSPPPETNTKGRPTSAPGADGRHQNMFEAQRPHVEKKQLWTPQDAPLSRSAFDPSNIASIQAQRSRAQALQPKNRKSFPAQATSSKTPALAQSTSSPPVYGKSLQGHQGSSREDSFNIMLQPETRPISQEQLVAEVKGIYAGLVMVEAKCIEVDTKQAALAQADASNPPKLNNEQWQALIALHRTLLHEHHDFFLASQHPSASPALRRLASKYAMPARMWRHGIHSFLELLRHRLPASLDHMLAFIYLAYSMMALLYETVSAFKDTWVECLGDLARYRMAIEDDDIRDREVWTGVARHWYSIASDNSPATGRLYHHLAILARPNALQQLFYYAKSLCVAIPFTSARESILTLFEPVLNADSGQAQGQYRLPPLDTAFVKAHGLLFTNRDLQKFDPAVKEFLDLLDTQIGRVTRKFMEQGYHIAVANSVAIVGFAAKDNVLMKALYPEEGEDVSMANTSEAASQLMTTFQNAQRLSNATTEIVLERVGDPNVLPFIHVTLIFMYFMARHPAIMKLLEAEFPWRSLAIMVNTILGSYQTPDRITDKTFPVLEKDDPRPFPEDFAVRGLLWTEGYFPDDFFTKKKIDEEEKYHERASMTSQRKERILWLACQIASLGPWLIYDGEKFSVPFAGEDDNFMPSRVSTFASIATSGSITRADTWEAEDGEKSDVEGDMPSPTTAQPLALSPHD